MLAKGGGNVHDRRWISFAAGFRFRYLFKGNFQSRGKIENGTLAPEEKESADFELKKRRVDRQWMHTGKKVLIIA